MQTQLASCQSCKLLVLTALLLVGCKKEPDPAPPVIPVCHSEPGGSSSAPIDWPGLPAISTVQPVFRDGEKTYKTGFRTGLYADGVATKQYRFTVVADASDGLRLPTDLDMNPIRPDELWISNYGEPFRAGHYSAKAYTVTVFNPGKGTQFAVRRKDKDIFTGHFFSYPTALAFNKDGYWANASFFNNNGNNGPTFWTSDFSVYADSVKYATNGSHNSMLHESFTSLGIAADENHTFWVLDGTTGDVVSYNFGKGHYPGGEDHTAGVIRRYPLTDVVKPVDGIPSHVSYEPSTKWLYVVDSYKRRIIRLKTTSGTVSGTKKGVDNAKEYSVMTAQSEILLDNLPLKIPCGIDTDGTQLYVSDYETGQIAVFDLATKKLVNTIETNAKGVTGVLLDKNARLWYVNQLTNELVRIDL